ncbi:MAG: hypothetical protein QM770_02090 [Tepidisphaeraceae bacterium]
MPRSDGPRSPEGNRRPGPRPYPPTVDGKLEAILKRLGRIEAMLIDLRDGNTGGDPNRPKYYIDPDVFR